MKKDCRFKRELKILQSLLTYSDLLYTNILGTPNGVNNKRYHNNVEVYHWCGCVGAELSYSEQVTSRGC